MAMATLEVRTWARRSGVLGALQVVIVGNWLWAVVWGFFQARYAEVIVATLGTLLAWLWYWESVIAGTCGVAIAPFGSDGALAMIPKGRQVCGDQ